MEAIQEEKFKRKGVDLTADVVTVKLNEEERKLIDKCKLILEQEKDATIIKQLAWIGAKGIMEEKTAYLLGVVFDNKRKNKRLGIADFE